MKSLEERKADRKEREAEAQRQKEESAKILSQGTGSTGTGEEEEEEDGYDSKTVKELKAELDDREIEYSSDAKKADLIALLEEDDEAE